MNCVGIIPARYQSTRFPGKPLAKIQGKPMIQWVVESAGSALEHVWVATDNDAIFETVESFGGNAVMTSPEHPSGTDRCAEAALKLAEIMPIDVVINIQGDEPFIKPVQLIDLMGCFHPEVQIATLIRKISSTEELFDPNKPKVVLGTDDFALYFSRHAIPFARGIDKNLWIEKNQYWAHIGIYGFRFDVLQQITKLPAGKLEQVEMLEQLRWLENGYKIKVKETDYVSFGIDTPEDLEHAAKLFT